MNMNNKLKLAFIGGGINSAVGTTHKIASQMDDVFELVAGCFSRNPEINNTTAEAWGVDRHRMYPDWQTLLSEEKGSTDAVVVLTPTSYHTTIIMQSLRSGYPVISEKALTTSSGEAMEIKKVLRSTGGFLAITYNYTGYPMLRELRHMIKGGELGTINQLHIEMPQEGFTKHDRNGNPPIPQEWRLHDGIIPTLSLDLGVHVHSMIEFLTGQRPVEVAAITNSFGSFRQVADNTICLANFDDGMVCNIWFSKSALGYRNGLRVRVFGTNGSAEWYQMDPEQLQFNDKKGRRSIIDRGNADIGPAGEARFNRFKAGHPAGFIEAFANYYYDIHGNLSSYLNGDARASEFVFTADCAIRGLKMLEAVAESATRGRFIGVDNSCDEN